MNTPSKTVALVVAAAIMVIATPALVAAGYSQAEVTRIFNEVKVLKENAAPKDATVGLQIDPVTSVATGASSRAELRFPDQSLTRLGANSRFTLRGDSRTLELDKGVMLMQVPEQIRGAKVRTAAVTAAVTGGTALIEYLPGGYVKLIVVEGVVDIVMNNDPSNFKQFSAGQMMIMKADGSSIPDGVDVDLKLLLKSSKLLNSNDKSSINQNLVNNAVQHQQQLIQSGQLQPTNLVLPGQGTYVAINTDNSQVTNIFNNFGIKSGTAPPDNPQNNPGPPNNNPGPSGNDNPKFQGFAPLIGGKTILNENATVSTHPHINGALNLKGGNLTQLDNASGILYRGLADADKNRAGDGPLHYFLFGDVVIPSAGLQPAINEPKHGGNGYWAVFKFEDLFINGTPLWDTGGFEKAFAVGGDEPLAVTNTVLASVGGIRVGPDSSFPGELPPPVEEGGDNAEQASPSQPTLDLSYSGLDNLVLYSQNGDIVVRSAEGTSAIYGYNQDVTFVSAGADVRIEGNIVLESGNSPSDPVTLTAVAGRDVVVQNATVTSDNISLQAGRDVSLNGGTLETRGKSITIQAKRHINIANSSQLKSLISSPDALAHLESAQGDVTITDSTLDLPGGTIDLLAHQGNITLSGVTASSEVFKAQTLGANGWITIGNSTISANTLIQLYADGATGGVRFVDNTTLDSHAVNIRGNTVEIVGGKVVNVPQGILDVQAVNHNYNGFGDHVSPGKGYFSVPAQHNP